MGHGIDVCLCGNVIAQCRCPGPHERRVVRQKCDACREREVPPAATAQPSAPVPAEAAGAPSPRERAILAINSQCLGYDPPREEDVLAAIEAAGLAVVDALSIQDCERSLQHSEDGAAELAMRVEALEAERDQAVARLVEAADILWHHGDASDPGCTQDGNQALRAVHAAYDALVPGGDLAAAVKRPTDRESE